VTQAEAGVASREEDVIVAEATVRNAEDNLRRFLAVPPDDPTWSAVLEPTDQATYEERDVDVDAAVSDAGVEAMSAFPRVEVQTLYVSADGAVSDRRHRAVEGDAQIMLQQFESPARLIVVGGGHIGLALAQIGELLGFRLTVLDDREEFANRERFPMAEEIITAELGPALDAIALDGSCHVVLVSRGHRQDEEALRHSVGRGAAFVGMIGSRRRTATVLAHLFEEGFERADLEAVSTPIGLDIGAETPEEIALSILAEIVMRRRGGSGERMVMHRAPID